MRLSVHLLVSCIVLLFNFNAGFATKSFSFRKFLPFANKVTRSTISDQPVQSNNKDNSTDATTEALRESIKNFGEPPLNELEVMGWWDGVMSSLVDQYSIGFLPRCTQFTKKDQFETEKHLVLVECRKRMQMIQALVNNADLSYEVYT